MARQPNDVLRCGSSKEGTIQAWIIGGENVFTDVKALFSLAEAQISPVFKTTFPAHNDTIGR
jgi:hypothetical protein